jgi:hypothetical protein
MSTVAANLQHEIESLQSSARMTLMTLQMNWKDVTHEQSLVQPQPAGNCLNWVVGHLLCIYNNALPLVKQQPLMDKGLLKQYDRGAKPITDGQNAMRFEELVQGLESAVAKWNEGLSRISEKELDEPAPFSPTNNPKETVRSLLTTVSFHQAYHAGQTGVLRRIIGKSGAIA